MALHPTRYETRPAAKPGKPEPYVTTMEGMSGHFAVLLWWNDEEDFLKPGEGFWEPYETGHGRYATEEEAAEEGRQWAETEGRRFVPRGERPPT